VVPARISLPRAEPRLCVGTIFLNDFIAPGPRDNFVKPGQSTLALPKLAAALPTPAGPSPQEAAARVHGCGAAKAEGPPAELALASEALLARLAERQRELTEGRAHGA